MDFSELLKLRRSVRDFEDRAVPQEMVEKLIDASLQAPSASNMQSWRFSIVHNRDNDPPHFGRKQVLPVVVSGSTSGRPGEKLRSDSEKPRL